MLVSNSLSGDLVGVVVVLWIILIGYFKWTYQYWRRKNVPFLEPRIPYGNLANSLRCRENIGVTMKGIYDEMKRKGWKHGGIYFLLPPAYFPIDLDYIKNIMSKDFQNFADRSFYYNKKDDPLSAHLIAIRGNYWRNLRTKALVDCEVGLQKKMENESLKKQPIDIKEIIACFITDVIGSCAFGLDCQTLDQEDSAFRFYGRRVSADSHLRVLKRTFSSGFPRLARYLGVTTTPKEVAEFFMKVIKDTVTYREENNYTRNDFVQLLIDLKNKKLAEGELDDESLTVEEIAAQGFVFFVAGLETSTATLTFALYELAKNQDIQRKLREEVNMVLGKHQDKITYDSIQDMKYMNQVIDETLRIYPPVPVTNRTCLKDYKVPGEDVIIEKGVQVIIPILAIHHDEEYYPDPQKFDPERFSEENKSSRHGYAHIPFGEGPRICIGIRFALMQSKFGLASLLRNFKFAVNKKTQEPLRMKTSSNILAAEGEVWLDAQKI